MHYNYIVVEGNIGAGKTTLATKLSEAYQARLILEAFADNPFLVDFYKNPAQFAFPVELFFMAERYKQQTEQLQAPDLFHQKTVSDYLFTKSLLFAKSTLNDKEFLLYNTLYDIVNKSITNADLLIYLHADVPKLQNNIKKRNRSFEQAIPDEYLERIQQAYRGYLAEEKKFPILVIDAAKNNFVDDKRAFEKLLAALEKTYSNNIHYLDI